MKPGVTKRMTYIICHNGAKSEIVSESPNQKEQFAFANELRAFKLYQNLNWHFETTCEPTDEQLHEWNNS